MKNYILLIVLLIINSVFIPVVHGMSVQPWIGYTNVSMDGIKQTFDILEAEEDITILEKSYDFDNNYIYGIDFVGGFTIRAAYMNVNPATISYLYSIKRRKKNMTIIKKSKTRNVQEEV